MKIGFDFDDTLVSWIHADKIQKLASILQAGGADLYIVTARCDGWGIRNDDLYIVAKKLNIPKEKILCTCLSNKFEFLKQHGIEMLFDDKWEEIHDVNSKGGLGFLIGFNPFKILQEENFTKK